MGNNSYPHPELRISASKYAEVRAWMINNDPDGPKMVQWANTKRLPPDTPEALAGEIIWIILCAGRNAQAARTIEKKVWSAIDSGMPVLEAFGHKGKSAAIERAWRDRAKDFAELQLVLAEHDVAQLVNWCGNIPYVGDDTKFQLAKNFGVDVCKPDIWLCRLSGIPDKPRRNVKLRFDVCLNLCRYLSASSGDSIATVDSILWLACNKGVLSVSSEGGDVSFTPGNFVGRPCIV